MNDARSRRCFLGLALGTVAGSATTVAAQGTEGGSEAVGKALAEATRRNRSRQMEDQAAYGKDLVQRFGTDVVEVIRETSIRRAREWTQEAGTSRDLDEVQKMLWDHLGPDFAYEVLERSPTRVRYKVTRCPYAEGMRKLDAAELGFAYNCAFDIGFCEGLNPEMRFIRTRTLMEGHDHCDHTYELAKTSR